MSGKWKRNIKWLIADVMLGVLAGSFMVFAAEDSGGRREDVWNVELPVVEEQEESVLDFILDPQGLVYETGAARYDGGSVEEGATLLFHNREGQYDFSRTSDKLVITNKSIEPVTVTISAYITENQDISVSGDEEFSEGECSLYLALVDNYGNEQPIPADEKASFSFDIEGIRDGMEAESYSFGLTGACNPNADWKDISACPKITVTWSVEPAASEENGSAVNERAIDQEQKPEETEAEPESGSESESMPEAKQKSDGGEAPEEGETEIEMETESESAPAEKEKATEPEFMTDLEESTGSP